MVDGTKPPYERVKSIKVLNTTSGDWQALDPKLEYRVAMSSYIAQGGDNHNFDAVPKDKIDKMSKSCPSPLADTCSRD